MPQWWELIPLDPDLVPEARSGVQDAFRAVVAQSWTLLTKGLQVCLAFSLGIPFFPFLFGGTSTSTIGTCEHANRRPRSERHRRDRKGVCVCVRQLASLFWQLLLAAFVVVFLGPGVM